MKALVFKDVGSIALQEVEEPTIKKTTDAIVRISATTICGTDLHAIRGTMPGMIPGTILGHEGVGVVEKVGSEVTQYNVGDRVIIPSTIACGQCDYCQKQLYAQCDNANPHGADKGTAFYGGPATSGPFQGMQAEKVRVPFADISLIKIPASVSDKQALLLSDVIPTSYMSVAFLNPQPNDTVAVFGCGPIGQLAIACLQQLGVNTIFAIDNNEYRLTIAQQQGARIINFDKEDPVKALKKYTDQKGPTKIIDAVGIDAVQPQSSLFDFFKKRSQKKQFKQELKEIAPKKKPHNGNWVPGNGPSQVLQWAVDAIAKNGTLSIIGVYTELLRFFPIGKAMEKNVTIRMGNCHHRAYIPQLLTWVEEKKIKPELFFTQTVPFNTIVDAYKQFDIRSDGWLKVFIPL